MKRFVVALVVAGTLAITSHVVLACVYPPLLAHMGFEPGSTIKISFIGTWGSERACVEDAFDKWEAASGAVGLNLDFVENSSQPNITLTKTAIAPPDAGGVTEPTLDAQGYTVGIGMQFTTNTSLLSNCSGYLKVALHEIGHAVGLDHTNGTNGSSVMNGMSGANDSGGNIPSDVTPCDRDRADSASPADPCDHGCPPGYTEFCQGDQQPDPARCNCCIDYTPVIVDLGDDGFSFSSAERGVRFAINSLGTTLRLAWPVRSDDMWLAIDVNRNGAIDDGSELFGNTTVLRSGVFARHGYEALADLDTNRDGAVDASDRRFDALLLWSDKNRNGFSEPHELISVRQAGLTSLSVDFRESRRTDQWGNRFRYFSTAVVRARRVPILTVDVYPTACPY